MFSQRRTRFLSDSEKHFASLFFNGHDVYYIYWSLLYLLTFELHRFSIPQQLPQSLLPLEHCVLLLPVQLSLPDSSSDGCLLQLRLVNLLL